MRAQARLATVGLAVGVAAMLAAPGVWAASVLDTRYGGTALNASAGPAGAMGGGAFIGVIRGPVSTPAQPVEAGAGGGGFGRHRAGQGFPGGRGGGGLGGPGGIEATATITLSPAEQRVYDYVSAHRDGAGYLMAVGSWDTAAPYIVATGQEVMPMGGFSGTVPEPALAEVQDLVRTGQLRFFLVADTGAAGAVTGFGLAGREGAAATIDAWVQSACAAVAAADYQAAAGTPGGTGTGGTLYECQRTA
jgi:hypothetical protein